MAISSLLHTAQLSIALTILVSVQLSAGHLNCTRLRERCLRYEDQCNDESSWKSCCDVANFNANHSPHNTSMMPSRIYALQPNGKFQSWSAFCDMESDGGGWLVILRRVSESDFNRTWQDYVEGFGELKHNFWYGLRAMHELTSNGERWELRVDLSDENSTSYVLYNDFKVKGLEEKFKLFLGQKIDGSGDCSINDNLKDFNGSEFSTKDNYTDAANIESCIASCNEGGWWYNKTNCRGFSGAVLTAAYKSQCYRWYCNSSSSFKSFSKYEMKIRLAGCLN